METGIGRVCRSSIAPRGTGIIHQDRQARFQWKAVRRRSDQTVLKFRKQFFDPPDRIGHAESIEANPLSSLIVGRPIIQPVEFRSMMPWNRPESVAAEKRGHLSPEKIAEMTVDQPIAVSVDRESWIWFQQNRRFHFGESGKIDLHFLPEKREDCTEK